MLINVFDSFASLVEKLATRVKIEHQSEGYAVIIDGVVYTWAVNETRARDIAIDLIETGV